LLAAYLRITGLAWGINSGYGHDLNFQPDEFVSLRGVLDIDLLTGNIRAPQAYFEGTFNYYLWAVPQAVLKILGKEAVRSDDPTSTTDHTDLLYVCRWMSVLFDLCTAIVIFLAITEATGRFYPPLLGMLCYAVLPMQVIYAHFMRTHILSNLLCALVIWLSFKLRKSQSRQLLVFVGLISGLGAATRYPVGIIVIIPCLYLLLSGDHNSLNWKLRILQRAKDLVTSQVWLIGLGFGIGLFLGHPMLFLDPSGVTRAITGETLRYASLQEFSGSQLLNLSVLWRYVTYLIPFAMYPLLWLVPYCAVLYLLFKRNLYSLSIPILIFSVLYLYLMGKGYLAPYFGRITMLLFPGLCVLVGIACEDLQLQMRNKLIPAVVLTCALVLILGSSVVFDIAYDRAMQQKDAREVVREDLKNLMGETPAKIGIMRFGAYFYTSMPAAKPLASQKVTVQLQDAGQDADFLLLGLARPISPEQINAIVRQVEARERFKYTKTYSVPLNIFGHEYRLARFPLDMTYAFPTILLFRARVPM
jgi:hypothetical protein